MNQLFACLLAPVVLAHTAAPIPGRMMASSNFTAWALDSSFIKPDDVITTSKLFASATADSIKPSFNLNFV